MSNLSNLSDRQLLELILANQVTLAQHIDKIKTVVHGLNPTLYSNANISKIQAYDELVSHSEEFYGEIQSQSGN